MRIVQTTGPSYSSGTDSSTQTQETSQNATVDQFDQNAGTNDSDASSSFHQIARAAADTTTQTQNTSPGTDNNVDVLQDNNGGKNDSDLDISGRSVAIAGHGHDNGSNRHASAADTALHQTQGSETGGLAGSTNQHSNIGEIDSAPRTQSAPQAQTGRSTLDATIHEDMLAFGPPTAVQEQHGPTACCSFQTGGGTQDHEHIRELINLFTSNGNPIQTDLNLLDCHSDNPTGCDGRIRANLNGNVGTVSCAGNVSPCDIGLVCSSVESEGACVPTPCIDTGEGCFVPPPCYPTCISASPSHKSSQARRE
jgi:hypothetical protein